MSDQLDLLAFLAPAPPPPASPPQESPGLAPPWPNAHLRPPRPVHPLAGPSPESLAALADVVMLDELPPVVPGSMPRIAVDRGGWDRAMAHRDHLVRQQIAGTLTPADAEALAALSYVQLQQVDWQPTGPMIITAAGYDHAANALAGFRCLAMENADG
jgi:hypothetical protein